jgi:hypothetical protein
MNRRFLRSAAIAFAAAVACTSAFALPFRTYLSADGLDTNPCSLPAPCRLLPAAIAAVTDGGEVWMLDSANYNTATVSIAKSVTILAVPGALGSVVAISGPAILVNSGSAKVALRNLVIVPFPGGSGTSGVEVTSAAKVTIEDCLIAGHGASGITITAAGAVRLTRSIVRDNTWKGMELYQGVAEISDSQLLGNGQEGLLVFTNGTTGFATVSNSVVSGNGAYGISVVGGAGTTTRVSVTATTVADNTSGGISSINLSGSSVVVTVGYSYILRNGGNGFTQGNTSVFESMGNNVVRQNGSLSSGTLSAPALF